jgi:hypothetical protein
MQPTRRWKIRLSQVLLAAVLATMAFAAQAQGETDETRTDSAAQAEEPQDRTEPGAAAREPDAARTPGSRQAAPERAFTPTERIEADTAVSFPADI